MRGKGFNIIGKKLTVVFIKLEQDSVSYSAAKCTQDGKFSSLTSYETISDLIKKEGKHFPYVLHVNGFGVLTRLVENNPNFKESLLVAGNQEDFYFNSSIKKGLIGVSFVRKSLLEETIVQLRNQKVFVYGLHIGPVPLLVTEFDTMMFNGEFTIELVNGTIAKFERNENGKQSVFNEIHSRGFSHGYFNTKEGYTQGIEKEVLSITRKDYKEYLRFVYLGLGILVFFLLSLSGNYFFVNHLNQKAAELEVEISSFGDNLAVIDRLNQEKIRKLSLIENSGIQSKRFLSFYLDQIGASVPSDISLMQLEQFPIVEPLKPKKKVELDHSLVKIQGETVNSEILDNWIEKLEKYEWVNGVELINYVRESESNAKFQITIKIVE